MVKERGGQRTKKAGDSSGVEQPRASCDKNVELTDFCSGESELTNIRGGES
jgi:hypothetical protein